MHIYYTDWHCPVVGCVWDIKIEYSILNDKPDVDAIYRKEPTLLNRAGDVGYAWVEWNDEPDDDLSNWIDEITEQPSLRHSEGF